MYGGAIAISSECSSTLTQLTLTSNSAFSGGGIYYQTAADTTHTLSDSMFSENAASDAGAGVVAYGSDTDLPVTIDRVTFDSNTAGSSGGGIFTQAPMDITNTTFFENGTTDDGSAGGAFGSNVSSSSPLIRIAFSTFVHNTADIAGGIYADGDTDVHLRANVFAYNTVSDVPDDCYGAITSEDYNYIGAASCTITPQANDVFDQTPPSYMFTATLRDAGGYVQTAYMWGPETVDIIPQADCEDAAGDPLDNDARGMSRPQSSYCDRGAYEKDGSDPVVTVTPGTDTLPCVTGSWTDAGATATDNFSSGLTASTEDTVDVHTAGEQIITYTSTPDSDYNTGTATRTVTVTDTLDPEITLVGSASVTIDAGETYTDAGATADDFCDGSVVVDTDNPVDTMTPGDYVVTYTAEDVSGNVTTATRSVTVSPVVPDRIRKTDIRVEKDGTDRIVKWPAADFATFYKLRITTKKGKVILLSTHLERHRKILTKKWRTQHLVEGKTYLIEVKACSEAGCSAWSNEKEWTPK
jgi:predicted outer membrane repeat protein